MPTFSNRQLRQILGTSYVGDTFVGVNEFTFPNLTYSGSFGLNQLIDLSLSGQNLYENATIRHIATGAASGSTFDYRVSSFNTGLGTFITTQFIQATVNNQDTFEVHTRLPPAQKDLAIDDALKSIRVRQEIGMMTGTGGAEFYDIEAAASPHYISDILDVYYFASPGGSLDRDQRRFDDVRMVNTGSGREIRVQPIIQGSQQIILDAILELTMGAGDTATITIPDDRWLLAGAAARCYNFMIQNTPGQNAGELAKRRAEWASEFTRLSGRFAPNYARKIRLEEPNSS